MIKKSVTDIDTDPDHALFRDSVTGTRPLKQTSERHYFKPENRQPVINRNTNTKVEQLDLQPPSTELQYVSTGDGLVFLRPGLQKKYLRKLRRGQYPIEDRLDLHGLNQQQAEAILLEFLEHARQQAFNCLIIIHGKGLRSNPARPALKILCDHFLRRHPAVMAFVTARATDGGSGAVYVLISSHNGIESGDCSHKY